MKLILLICLLSISLTSCYISKTINTPCTIYINPNIQIDFSQSMESKYLNTSISETYKNSFYNGLKNELSIYGVTVIETPITKTNFSLSIKTLKLKESSNTETVNDYFFDFKYRYRWEKKGVDFFGISG